MRAMVDTRKFAAGRTSNRNINPPALPQVIVVDPVTERVWELGNADGLPLPKVAETPTAWEDYRVLAVPWRPGEVCMAGSFGRH